MHDFLSSRKHLLSEQNYLLHLLLFLLTFFCTVWAGTFWTGHPAEMHNREQFIKTLPSGLPYACCLIAFLSVHESGHFIATFTHRIRATLPYFIPVPPLPFLLSIGTMGAVIRVKDRITDTRALLDTGAAGPLGGFAVALGLLLYGFFHLPPTGFIFAVHPEYLASGGIPNNPEPGTLYLGKNLLFVILETLIAPKGLPPMTEIYHYPFLFTGWLGCFVTTLNLLPVGQLDGGHVTYALFGKKGHTLMARSFLLFIILLGLPSFTMALLSAFVPGTAMAIPQSILGWSWPGWILWAFILSRFIGISHPPAYDLFPLGTTRKTCGWACIAVFILTFTPVPFGMT